MSLRGTSYVTAGGENAHGALDAPPSRRLSRADEFRDFVERFGWMEGARRDGVARTLEDIDDRLRTMRTFRIAPSSIERLERHRAAVAALGEEPRSPAGAMSDSQGGSTWCQ